MNTINIYMKSIQIKDWNGHNLSKNPNITMEFIEKVSNKPLELGMGVL